MQLVINTFGASLRKEGERFCVQTKEKKFQVSAMKVQSILITTGAHFSSDVVKLANEHNIDIIFLDRYGDPYARVWHAKMGSTAAIRRRQIEVAETQIGLQVAVDWVGTKLGNQLQFLDELERRRPGAEELFRTPSETIEQCMKKLDGLAGSLEDKRGTIMGLEGSAGRAYFGCLGRLMPKEYRFKARSRQPAQDAFNAMLNYGYGVLYSMVERACILAGLDPFVGFLHTDNYNKKSLVFDLIEPFRIIAERTVVFLFTGRRVRKDMIEEVPGGVSLNKEGKALLIGSLNERLDKAVRYPARDGSRRTRNLKQRDIIQHEAHALANRLLGRKDMPRIVETEEIWAEDGPTA